MRPLAKARWRRTAWLLVSCFSPLFLLYPSWAASQVSYGVTANPTAGARVYGSLGCPECHTVNGYGAGTASDLATSGRARSFFGLASDVWNHFTGSFPHLAAVRGRSWVVREDEVRDLLAFLFSLGYADAVGDAEAGEKLFTARGCRECHQTGGAGGIEGPSLDHLRFQASPIQVMADMWNHGPRMRERAALAGTDWPTLSGTEFRDLIAYLERGGAGVEDRPVYLMPGDAGRGRALFESKGCGLCHRPGGAGPDLSGRLRSGGLMDLASTMWNHQPGMAQEARREGSTVPTLSPGEMADIVAHLYSLRYLPGAGRAWRGRALVREGGCLGCHRLGGRGGGTASDIGEMRDLRTPSAVVAAMWNHGPLVGGETGAKLRALDAAAIADLAAFLVAESGG